MPIPPFPDLDQAIDLISARALRAVVEYHRPSDGTNPTTAVAKTPQQLHRDSVRLDCLLEVLVNDLHLASSEAAMQATLEDLACRHHWLSPDRDSATGLHAPAPCPPDAARAAVELLHADPLYAGH